MGRVYGKATTMGVLAALGVTAFYAALFSCPLHRIRVLGNFPPAEVAELEKAARDDLFRYFQKNSSSGWLPIPPKIYAWNPLARPIFNARHPIDIIEVRADNRIVVWFRGPEMKAYVNGKEHGWYLRSMTTHKAFAGRTNSFAWVNP